MTSQAIHRGRGGRITPILVSVALIALLAAATAGAKQPVRRANSTAGHRVSCKVVHRAGKTKAVRACRKKATETKAAEAEQAASSAPAKATSPASPGAPASGPEAPATPEVPGGAGGTGTPPNVSTGPTEVHAAIGAGFSQNPLVPNEVTWRYSASASRTATTNGVPQTETVPLPEGELAFFVDGQLDCVIHAIGAISASACSVDLKQLGGHEVSAIYQEARSDGLSSTAVRTDYIGKYPTSTNLQVSVEPTAPEYLSIGPNKSGFEQYAFEVGRLRITGSTSPGGYPTFDCEGQSSGCLDPEVSLKSRNGSVTVPLFAQHRLNSVTGQEEWHVAFGAYDPALRESGFFWQYPEESVGTQFLHAVSEPNLALYEPSSIDLPLNLNGGHYPFYRWMKNGEAGGSVAAVEGTMRRALVLGTYDKFDGPQANLKFSGRFYGAKEESEGCLYQPRADGVGLDEHRVSSIGGFDTLNGFPNLAAGPHTLELWVERKAGSGPGNCALTTGWFEAYEVVH